ncbi:MAG: hypothetical protein ACPHER_02435 [Nevskiales bacterium]
MKKTVLLTALLALPVAGWAEGLSYNHVQVDWIANSDLDANVPGTGSGETDGDGFGLSALLSVSEVFYLVGNYQDTDYDDGGLAIEEISLGVGAHNNTYTGAIDVFGNITFENIDVDGAGDDNGFGFEIGARTVLSGALDGFISYDYDDVGDLEGNFFRAGVSWAFNPQWSVAGQYSTGEYEGDGFDLDRDELSIGLRYHL